jgi:hypothetical protein
LWNQSVQICCGESHTSVTVASKCFAAPPNAVISRYGEVMSITRRLTQIISSAFTLAAAPQSPSWTTPEQSPDHPSRSASPPQSSPESPPQSPPDQGPIDPLKSPPLAKPNPQRDLVVFAAGFALAAAATVGIWLLIKSDSWATRQATASNAASGSAVATGPTGSPGGATAAPGAQASGQPVSCPSEPIVAAASEKDGRFPLQPSVEGLIAADITSFMVIGNQASTSGQPRDAEAAFLMSCRVADKLKGPRSAETAETKYQLGAFYGKLAIAEGVAGTKRAELLNRAERVYQDSLQSSIAIYGKDHEKTQLAAQGLDAVRQSQAQGESQPPTRTPVIAPAPAPAPVTAPATPTARAPATAIVPAPAPATAIVPAPASAPAPAPATAAAPAAPKPVPPLMAAAPPARPSPATDSKTDGQSRQQDPSPAKKCPDAVAALGLCSP